MPDPVLKGDTSLEESLYQRRSVRDYRDEPLTLAQAAQILWAAQGKTADWGGRTAPSAGGLYPLDIYLVAGNVGMLAPAIYRYDPQAHALIKVKDGDMRAQLSTAALGQSAVKAAPVDLVVTAVYARVTEKYGQRGERYTLLEAGHAAQNICLQLTALGLGGVTIGAFDDGQVANVMGLSGNQTPLYIIPAGRPK